MWTSYYCIFFVLLYLAVGNLSSSRVRRYLIFTPATQWGVFATIAIPIHPETAVSVAWFYEANYYIVDNTSYLDPLLGDITTSRKRYERHLDANKNFLTRAHLYSFLETMFERHGYPGRACLLRAICDNASSHFLHNGVLGDLLHLALTPSTSMSEDDVDDQYYEAEYYGSGNQCEDYAIECPLNPLEQLSIKIDNVL